jgi:hypothetical protein
MKVKIYLLVVSALLGTYLPANAQNAYQRQWQAFQQQLLQDNISVSISPEDALALILHQEPIVWKQGGKEGGVSGTVIVGFEISRKGEVLHPMVLAGPSQLQRPVLDAVRKYKFNPYKMGDEAITVGASLTIDASNSGGTSN